MSRVLTFLVVLVDTLLLWGTLASALAYGETKNTVFMWNLFIFPVVMVVITVAHGIYEENREAARRDSMSRHPSALNRRRLNQSGTQL